MNSRAQDKIKSAIMKNIFVTKTWFFVLLIFAGLTFSLCQDDKDRIAGKVDPATIADTNLIAYFPFDREPEGGAAVANSNSEVKYVRKLGEASFVPGRRGNAFQGSTAQSCLEFDVVPGSSFTNLDEFTLTCWLKTSVLTDGVAKIFGLNGGDPLMGNIALLQEGRPQADSGQVQADSVDLKLFMFDSSSTEWKAQEISVARQEFTKDEWFHFAALYRKSTSTMELFADGKKVISRVSFTGPVPESGNQTLLGDITPGSDISKIYFGAWPQQLAGTPESWMKYYNGLIDEFRIFNKALSEEELTFLYEAELSQIEE